MIFAWGHVCGTKVTYAPQITCFQFEFEAPHKLKADKSQNLKKLANQLDRMRYAKQKLISRHSPRCFQRKFVTA